MADSDRIHEELTGLSQRKRVAFAAGCVERARALFDSVTNCEEEWYYDAIDVVWNYVMGLPWTPEQIADAKKTVDGVLDGYADEEETGYLYAAVRALRHALDAPDDPSTESAESAAAFSIDAATGSTVEDTHIDEAEAEEDRFQGAVLDLLKPLPADDPIGLDVFEALGWDDEEGWPDPKWLTRYEEDDTW